MKFLVTILSFLFLNLQNIDLKVVRNTYKDASVNKEIARKLYLKLAKITKANKIELIAYKGATIALKGRFSKKIKDKVSYFKEGTTLLEYAIKKSPQNIEIRLIRLGIQENTPRLLKYKMNIKEDKQLILQNFKNIKSSSLKEYIKSYILQSKVFTAEEKLVI